MKRLTCIIIFSILFLGLRADNYSEIVNLEGRWKFSAGDNPAWSSPAFDDSDWDEIRVPRTWESQGYQGYDGFAWYRKSFSLPPVPENEKIVFILGSIDDTDEVYFNGEKIGSTGHPFPDFYTGYTHQRRYVIPGDLLIPDGKNQISVRVYDAYLDGGIIDGPVGLFLDKSAGLLELDLSGDWRFKVIGSHPFAAEGTDNSGWKSIKVPSDWESQGYYNYDGKAVYMLNFYMPVKLKGEKLYLILGRIDDIEQVQFNDQTIGSFTNFTRDPNKAYDEFRYYALPGDLIKFGNSNHIIVMVEDHRGPGGIIEGPVGIACEANIDKLKSYNDPDRSIWDYLFDD
ncbi:MAG: hypothetical protein K9G58_11610 [Bacteroidales bacterium]|nr:hypothetical protein [Bacteroidales bacterium]MCF8387904.1 hypothetical protein [Bacteroidales bacterium]MCF8398810.1 hypothetical protein [Bacteroidales bacterium]